MAGGIFLMSVVIAIFLYWPLNYYHKGKVIPITILLVCGILKCNKKTKTLPAALS